MASYDLEYLVTEDADKLFSFHFKLFEHLAYSIIYLILCLSIHLSIIALRHFAMLLFGFIFVRHFSLHT